MILKKTYKKIFFSALFISICCVQKELAPWPFAGDNSLKNTPTATQPLPKAEAQAIQKAIEISAKNFKQHAEKDWTTTNNRVTNELKKAENTLRENIRTKYHQTYGSGGLYLPGFSKPWDTQLGTISLPLLGKRKINLVQTLIRGAILGYMGWKTLTTLLDRYYLIDKPNREYLIKFNQKKAEGSSKSTKKPEENNDKDKKPDSPKGSGALDSAELLEWMKFREDKQGSVAYISAGIGGVMGAFLLPYIFRTHT